MNVQNINNQQPQFGRVARLKVTPIFLPDIRIDDTVWKGMKNPPFRLKINETPHENGLFDVVIFGGRENRRISRAERKLELNEQRRGRIWCYWYHDSDNDKFTRRKERLIKEKETLMKTLEEKASAPVEVKSSFDICRIRGFKNYLWANS